MGTLTLYIQVVMSDPNEMSRAEKVKRQALEKWEKQSMNLTASFSDGRSMAKVRYIYVSDIPTSIPYRPVPNRRNFIVTLNLTSITETEEKREKEVKDIPHSFYPS